MKSPKHVLAVAALLLGAGGMIAQTTSDGTSSAGTTSGTSTTGTGTTSDGSTSGGTTSGGTTTGGTTTGGTMTGDDNDSGSGHGKGAGNANGKGNGGAAGKSGDDHGKAAPHTPDPHSSDVAKAVQAVLQKFDANRDQFIADRKALLDQLAAAKTEAERKAILEQLKAENETEKQQKEQLGKEIRDELRTMRQQRKSGGG
jgi:hypothetical protein